MVIQGCAKLEESRRVAEAELAALDASEERVRELKADRDAFIAFHAEAVPEELDGLSGEKRMRIYQMLRLKVRPNPEGCEIGGALCNGRPTGTEMFCEELAPGKNRWHHAQETNG